MSRMSMPFRGRTITTTVSGGGGGWLGLVALAVLALVVWRAVAVTATSSGWQRANEVVGEVLGTALVVTVVGVGLVVVALLLPEFVDLNTPAERRRIREFRANAAAASQATALREAARLAAVAGAEEALAATEGLDGARDGRLIDAADRFRSLGTFLPDQSTSVDHDSTTVDQPSTALDREA